MLPASDVITRNIDVDPTYNAGKVKQKYKKQHEHPLLKAYFGLVKKILEYKLPEQTLA